MKKNAISNNRKEGTGINLERLDGSKAEERTKKKMMMEEENGARKQIWNTCTIWLVFKNYERVWHRYSKNYMRTYFLACAYTYVATHTKTCMPTYIIHDEPIRI